MQYCYFCNCCFCISSQHCKVDSANAIIISMIRDCSLWLWDIFRLTDHRSDNLMLWIVVRLPLSSRLSVHTLPPVSQNSFSEFFRNFHRTYYTIIPPDFFFPIFDWIDFGHLAAIYVSKLANLGYFSTLNVIFSKTVQ